MPLNRKKGYGKFGVWVLDFGFSFRRSLLIVSAVAAIAILFFPRHRPEPQYQGKPLSDWMEPLHAEYARMGTVGARWTPDPVLVKNAEDAVKAIGPNAVPYLLAELSHRTPRWIAPLPTSFSRRWRLGADSFAHRTCAMTGFLALGTNALIALPELERRLDDSDPMVKFLLSYIGDTIHPIYQGGDDASDGITAVTFYGLNHPEPAVRQAAVKLLCRGYISTNTVLAKLTIAAKDSDPEVQREAVKRLAAYRK